MVWNRPRRDVGDDEFHIIIYKKIPTNRFIGLWESLCFLVNRGMLRTIRGMGWSPMASKFRCSNHRFRCCSNHRFHSHLNCRFHFHSNGRPMVRRPRRKILDPASNLQSPRFLVDRSLHFLAFRRCRRSYPASTQAQVSWKAEKVIFSSRLSNQYGKRTP